MCSPLRTTFLSLSVLCGNVKPFSHSRPVATPSQARKHQDLYVWMSKTPAGPSVKFNVSNVHTMSGAHAGERHMPKRACEDMSMAIRPAIARARVHTLAPTGDAHGNACFPPPRAELKLTGNHLKGSRPVLFFDAAFESAPHLKVIKEVMTQVFVTPKGHRKSKPFLDHVICFYWRAPARQRSPALASHCTLRPLAQTNASVALSEQRVLVPSAPSTFRLDKRVWFRNYQAIWPEGKSKEPPALVEV